MKNAKKLVSLFLAIAMVFVMTATAFAEGTKLTISGEDGRTYVGYKLLNLTTSLKVDKHHEAHSGAHTSGCYNYAYTVNAKYRSILQAEALENGSNNVWGTTGKPTDASGVTDEQIIDYLAEQTSGDGSMRDVADNIYAAIKNMEADAENLTGTGTIDQGYWLFADVTDLSGANKANSLVIVDTKGQDNLTINAKTALPTIEKKVKDIEDSKDNNITDNDWQDSADHDFGDKVPFKLTATLPSNAQQYKTYKLVFHDKLSSGLTLDKSSIKVYMYNTKEQADNDAELNDTQKEDVTANFDIIKTGLDDDCTFEVGCDNVLAIDGVTNDTAFVVYYEATLNVDATIGSAGNPNVAYLEFSNNPYNTNGTGETEEDKVTVFTYQIVVNKTDSNGDPLKGAGFTLSKKKKDGSYTIVGTELKGNDMTTFTWQGLDDGDYKLEETTVPSGFNKMSDIIFSVSAEHDPQLKSLDGGLMGKGVVSTGTITKDIINNTGTILPETGAKGTMLLIGGGATLAILAAVFMVTRKKMSVYED